MNKPLVMLGGGGHATILADVLLSAKHRIIAVVTPEEVSGTSPLIGIERISSDQNVLTCFAPDEVELINGVGSMPGDNLRKRLFDYFSQRGYRFASVISSHAIISKYSYLEEGVQVMAGAIVQTSARIGRNSIINSGAIIEHDCIIGEHNHIAPGATLSGGVVTAPRVHIGTGAAIVQAVRIEQDAVVGAGATVARNVPARQVLIPARSRVLS